MLTAEMLGLVRKKLAVTRIESADVSPDRLAALQLQLVPQPKAVLRGRDFAEFDLGRAFATVVEVAKAIDQFE